MIIKWNRIPTNVNSEILHINFLDAGLCNEEVMFKCCNAFFLNKLGTRQQDSPDRKANHAVNSDDVQREHELSLSWVYMYELHHTCRFYRQRWWVLNFLPSISKKELIQCIYMQCNMLGHLQEKYIFINIWNQRRILDRRSGWKKFGGLFLYTCMLTI